MIILVLETCGVIEAGVPLRQTAQEIAKNLILWWSMPEEEGGGGKQTLDQVDFSSFFRNPAYTETLGIWDSNSRNIPNFNVNNGAIQIISQYGTYQLNVSPPYKIELSGSRRANRRLITCRVETVIDLSDNPGKEKIRLKYRTLLFNRQ